MLDPPTFAWTIKFRVLWERANRNRRDFASIRTRRVERQRIGVRVRVLLCAYIICLAPMLLSDEKYGRHQQHDHCGRQHYRETEYELFLKPHHRLDRKSSRGMIYENEELRLRTININAEIERGQYDIKKLKKENELLKKEIWCLRDEYEKLDKLLKEKNIDFSSSSTTSDSDSSSSCLDESDDVENCQNFENDQKTNMGNLGRSFAALSVVPEESTENSDRTSDGTSLVNDHPPSHHQPDGDVIQADESYPSYEHSATLKMQSFASRDTLQAREVGDQRTISPCEQYEDAVHQYISNKIVNTEATNFYQNIVLVPRPRSLQEVDPLEKAGTDVLAKTDNRGFAVEPNGGGGDYLAQFADDFPRYYQNFGTTSRSTFSNGGNLEELLNDIETISQDILAISNGDHADHNVPSRRCKSDINPDEGKNHEQSEKPFKSELNVTLMPQPMALIGLEKYRDLQRSMNTTPSKSMENLSANVLQDNQLTEKKDFQQFQLSTTDISDFTPICPATTNISDYQPTKPSSNLPSYLANLKDNYVSGDYFSKYNPCNFPQPEKPKPVPKILVKQVSLDLLSSENDENAKIKQEPKVQKDTISEETPKKEDKQKMGLRKKVSIHFRGKKEKQKKSLEVPTNTLKKISPVRDKKTQEETKTEKMKISHQKTSSKDSNKTTSESDSKNNPDSRRTVEKNENEKKQRKSASVSPDRKKREEKKCKKHKKERIRIRRATITSLESRDHRARSHSVNTERSNTYGGSHLFYEDYMNSDRDSISSLETLKTRQMNFSNVPMAGKVPWCGCWGNGCI
ncbi:uncharacterized protein LOC123676344 isoform X2 [Harmonia axyridis]|uniref:uncharacterized protein LOC123676344 isoform X2 n=1 Tax=Harmonia axyridis TaxID=115357 RepID=UPI001E275BFD|nr:uncharacterized protein LOC123676344 isoform X2 [Harmonia axyridis]